MINSSKKSSKKRIKEYRVIKGGKVIGSGSYGCVISPAIVFDFNGVETAGVFHIQQNELYGLDPVTIHNSDKYVTKISLQREAELEWESQAKIKNRLDEYDMDMSTFGIFPLAMHCLSRQYVQKLILRFKRSIPKATVFRTYQLDEKDKENRACDIDPSKEYCGLQVKRFEKNGEDYLEEIVKRREQITGEELVSFNNNLHVKLKTLYIKLHKLIDLGIFHNDIKLDNIAVLEKGDLVFLDWGLSVVDEQDESIGGSKYGNFNWIRERGTTMYNLNKELFGFYYYYLFYFFSNSNDLDVEYYTVSNMLRYHFSVVQLVLGDFYKNYSSFYEKQIHNYIDYYNSKLPESEKLTFNKAKIYFEENFHRYNDA